MAKDAAYYRDYRARKAAARAAPVARQEEAPEAARRVPSAAPRKVAPVVGGYQARPEDGWVARMTSRQQADILARMAGEPRSRGEGR